MDMGSVLLLGGKSKREGKKIGGKMRKNREMFQ